MNVIQVVWNECKLLIDKYEEEQESIIKLRQEILKVKDLEFYKNKFIDNKLSSINLSKEINQTNEYIDDFDLLKQIMLTNRNEICFNRPMKNGGIPSKLTNANDKQAKKYKNNHIKCYCDDCKMQNLIICGILDSNLAKNNITSGAGGSGSDSGCNENDLLTKKKRIN